jgi:hypothetical protein
MPVRHIRRFYLIGLGDRGKLTFLWYRGDAREGWYTLEPNENG